jgi:hypothetical protein
VLKKLRADWRRGRALKALKLGERQYWEWDSKTSAGTLCGNLRFDVEGDALVLTFAEIWAKDPDVATIQGRNDTARADLGMRGSFAFVELVAALAEDVGCTKLRIRGQRTRARRTRLQDVEFDVARFRRGHRQGR